jgi:hypothetical protein
MTAITALSADFEGTDGATATAGSIGATSITGGGTATFSGTDPQQGSTDLQCVGGSGTQVNVRWDFTAVTTFWDCFYFKTPSVAPAATTTIATWYGNSGLNLGGALRLNTDMTLTLRDASTAVTWTGGSGTSSPALPTNTWVRIAIKAVPGSTTGHRCRVYVGSNRHGTTPDLDSGNQTATAGTNTNVDSWRMGLATNGVNTVHLDRNRADDATEPAGLTVGGPPTVNAGPDLTKETGSGSFTITATATPASGATIASRSWQILSGLTVTLSGTTTDTVTVTAPTSTTGTTVLRYTATDNTSQSATDDVTLTWVAPGQTLYPVADVSNPGGYTTQSGGTTSLFGGIDDVVLDTTDYVSTPQLGAVAVVYRLRLQSKPAPTNTTGWYLRINKRDTPDVATSSLIFKLYEADGTTLRKTWSAITTVNTTDTEYQLTLTSAEVAAITTWASGLIVEVSATGT